jgi:Type VI secretion system effector, Hcp
MEMTMSLGSRKTKRRKIKSSVSRDNLVHTRKDGDGIDLTEAELRKVSGGLKLEGIDGKSQDSKHKGEIEIRSFAWAPSGGCGY